MVWRDKMSLKSIYETMDAIGRNQIVLSEEDKQSVMQFAFKTDDMELTNMFIEDLCESVEEKTDIYKKYEAILDKKPTLVTQVENLLVAIELYRMEEEKALKKLTQVLAAYGIEDVLEENKEKELGGFEENLVKDISL